jgi:hypothetical protein
MIPTGIVSTNVENRESENFVLAYREHLYVLYKL